MPKSGNDGDLPKIPASDFNGSNSSDTTVSKIIKCADGYKGTVKATCGKAGETYTLSGCTAFCKAPKTHYGFILGDGIKELMMDDFSESSGQLENPSTISCDTANGWKLKKTLQATVCEKPGGEYTLTGCDFNCTFPTGGTNTWYTGLKDISYYNGDIQPEITISKKRGIFF